MSFFVGKLVPFLEHVGFLTSILTTQTIAYERYKGVSCPINSNLKKSSHQSAIFATWIISGIFSLPMVAMAQTIDAHLPDGTFHKMCVIPMNATWKEWYMVSKFILFFLLMLVTLMYFVSKMSYYLLRNTTFLANHTTRGRNKLKRSRRRVIFLLLAVLIAFSVCLLPHQVLSIWVVFAKYRVILIMGHNGLLLVLHLSRAMFFSELCN